MTKREEENLLAYAGVQSENREAFLALIPDVERLCPNVFRDWMEQADAEAALRKAGEI